MAGSLDADAAAKNIAVVCKCCVDRRKVITQGILRSKPASFLAGAQLKFPFVSNDGSVEHMWCTIHSIEGDKVIGQLNNHPIGLYRGGLKCGDRVVRKLNQATDFDVR